MKGIISDHKIETALTKGLITDEELVIAQILQGVCKTENASEENVEDLREFGAGIGWHDVMVKHDAYIASWKKNMRLNGLPEIDIYEGHLADVEQSKTDMVAWQLDPTKRIIEGRKTKVMSDTLKQKYAPQPQAKVG